MRRCGACVYSDHDTPAPPSAACVVAFARTQWDGLGGILAHIGALAESSVVPRASSYCTECRTNSWLCRPEKDLSEAALDFWHQWQSGNNIMSSMRRMAASVRKRKRDTATDGTFQGCDEDPDASRGCDEDTADRGGPGRHSKSL